MSLDHSPHGQDSTSDSDRVQAMSGMQMRQLSHQVKVSRYISLATSAAALIWAIFVPSIFDLSDSSTQWRAWIAMVLLCLSAISAITWFTLTRNTITDSTVTQLLREHGPSLFGAGAVALVIPTAIQVQGPGQITAIIVAAAPFIAAFYWANRKEAVKDFAKNRAESQREHGSAATQRGSCSNN